MTDTDKKLQRAYDVIEMMLKIPVMRGQQTQKEYEEILLDVEEFIENGSPETTSLDDDRSSGAV